MNLYMTLKWAIPYPTEYPKHLREKSNLETKMLYKDK